MLRINNLYQIIFCICYIGDFILANPIDIEQRKQLVLRIVQNNPAAMRYFYSCFQRFDQLAIQFFSDENNDSLHTHIRKMEEEIETLKTTINNPQYTIVRPILCSLHHDVTNMVSTLKKHNSSDAIMLGLKIKQYRFLLPSQVKERNIFSLYMALRHRLNCRDNNEQ